MAKIRIILLLFGILALTPPACVIAIFGECENDGECAFNEFCDIDGVCVFFSTCFSDFDCGGGEFCDSDFLCQTSLPPPRETEEAAP